MDNTETKNIAKNPAPQPESAKIPEERPDEKPVKKPVKKPVMERISNILSAVFSPILVPTYAYAIAMWTTQLSAIPEDVRFKSSLVVFFITAAIPLATILVLIRAGKVSDPAISNPKERLVPYSVTMLCYFAAALYLSRMPLWLPGFFVGAGLAAIFDSIINLRWKISAHATSMGGLCALLLYIGFHQLNTVLIIPWIANAFLFSGAVGSARLYLKRHTPAQVYTGWLLGLAVAYASMTLVSTLHPLSSF